jgi:hypothetical protein
VDVTHTTSQLIAVRLQPMEIPLPQDRYGVRVGGCQVLPEDPITTAGDAQLKAAQITGECGDGPMDNNPRTRPGEYKHKLAAQPAAGTVCSVSLEDAVLKLPPLPETPDVVLDGRDLTWTPTGADEVRVVALTEAGTLLCRYPDQGTARLPRSPLPGRVYVSRYAYGQGELAGELVPLAATVGITLQVP